MPSKSAPPSPPGARPSRPGPPAPSRSRAPRRPLDPPRAGEPSGESPDPELDVAPNLGGETQMQDA